MSKSPIGRSFSEIVQRRTAREPAFASALLEEAVQCMLSGELPAARSLIRDVIKSSMGYAELSRRTGTPEKSLVRMFGPAGNPTAANITSVLHELQQHGRVRLRVRAEPAAGPRQLKIRKRPTDSQKIA
jgi:DNA-binding phage protein